MLDQTDGLKDLQATDAPPRAPSQKDANRPRDWADGLRGLHRSAPGYLWQATQFIYENFASFVGKCLTAVVILVVLMIVYEGLTRHVTVIDTISVPKPLADRGYTQDVVAQRFRDALAKFSASLKTDLTTTEVALHADQPDIVVPTVGISLDAVMSLLRSLLRSTRSQSMGGELTIDNDKLWLRLRLNGVEFYRSKEGVDPQNLDAVFVAAVPEAIRKISPYLLAYYHYYGKNYDAAFDLSKWIIANLPEADENVAHAYNLRGIILILRKEYPAAEQELRKAMEANKQFAAPHVNLGNIRKATNKSPEAIAEYREAIRLNPRDALAHDQLGIALIDSGKPEEAVQELRAASALDPKAAVPHNNIGVALHRMKDDDGAIAEYREAIELKHDYAVPHSNLAIILAARRDLAGAVAEAKEAIRLDRDNLHAHENLGNWLLQLGKPEEAVPEFREVMRLQPKDVGVGIRLAQTLDKLGKQDDAAAEFQAMLKLDPTNKAAVDYL